VQAGESKLLEAATSALVVVSDSKTQEVSLLKQPVNWHTENNRQLAHLGSRACSTNLR
jgi:hypothetical protein